MKHRDQSMAQLQRDAAIERTRRTRRWLIAGAAGLTAGIAALVSSVAPGRTLGASAQSHPATRASASTGSSEAQMPPLANPNALGLQGPVQNPQPASDPSSSGSTAPSQAPPPAPAPVSGGS